jgi:hypothetical protein
LTRKLSNFYQTLDARVMVFQKLLNFYGRLDLVMQQVSMHQQDVTNTSNDPILSYIESSDEDEDDESDDDDEDEEKVKYEIKPKNIYSIDIKLLYCYEGIWNGRNG